MEAIALKSSISSKPVGYEGERAEDKNPKESTKTQRHNHWSELPMLDEGRLILFAQETLSTEKVTFVSSLTVVKKPEVVKKEMISQQIREGNNLIFIPIILKNAWSSFSWVLPKSLIPRHLVVITIDKENKLVEYFDPKGKNPFRESRSVDAFEGSLITLLSVCNRAIGNGRNTVDYSPAVLQTDFSSCGYFGAHFMRLRSSQSFAKVINTKMDLDTIRTSIDALDENSVYTNPEKFADEDTPSRELMCGAEVDEMFK